MASRRIPERSLEARWSVARIAASSTEVLNSTEDAHRKSMSTFREGLTFFDHLTPVVLL